MSSSTPQGMLLRTGTVGDAAAAAALHAGQISEGFLTILGQPFLTRLYRRVVRTPGSFLLVVDDGTVTAGFLAGSTDVSGLYRSFLVHDGVMAALACGSRLFRSWRHVLETLRHGTGTSAGAGAELLAVAVDPAVRGRAELSWFAGSSTRSAGGVRTTPTSSWERTTKPQSRCTCGPGSVRRSGSNCIRAPSRS